MKKVGSALNLTSRTAASKCRIMEQLELKRAELAAFEALLSKCIADALVAKMRKEAEAHGVDVLTWL